jgi:hypothetical protein
MSERVERVRHGIEAFNSGDFTAVTMAFRDSGSRWGIHSTTFT